MSTVDCAGLVCTGTNFALGSCENFLPAVVSEIRKGRRETSSGQERIREKSKHGEINTKL